MFESSLLKSIKYLFIKVLLTALFYALSGQQSFGGWSAIIFGCFIATAASLPFMFFLFLLMNKKIENRCSVYARICIYILIIFMLNDLGYFYFLHELTFIDILQSLSSTGIAFKISDSLSIIITCLVLLRIFFQKKIKANELEKKAEN